MATELEVRTQILTDALAPPPDEGVIKRQLDLITWLKAPEISKELVTQLGLDTVMVNISTNPNIKESLRLDAERLLARWGRGVWDAPHTESSYRSTGPGDLGLVVGDCWPSRELARKEGCHGVPQAGIHGNLGYGAFSIVANGLYNDQDSGDTLWYSGTDAKKEGIPTTHTKYMIRSHTTGNPVRVIRGANCGKYAPSKGCRYDGLYKVTNYQQTPRKFTASAKGEGNYEFFLERIEGQPPIQTDKPDNETLVHWHNWRLNERN